MWGGNWCRQRCSCTKDGITRHLSQLAAAPHDDDDDDDGDDDDVGYDNYHHHH